MGYRDVLERLHKKEVNMLMIKISDLTTFMERHFNGIIRGFNPLPKPNAKEEKVEDEDPIRVAPLYKNVIEYTRNVSHFIFLIDASGSMEKHWEAIKKVYNRTVLTLRNLQKDFILTAYKFDKAICRAPVLYPVRVTMTSQLYGLGNLGGGATEYLPPLNTALDKIIAAGGQDTTIIFMSDGKPSNKDANNECLKRMSQIQANCTSLNFHCISFCYKDNDEAHFMKQLTEVVDNGHFHEIKETGKEILEIDQLFQKIARGDGTSGIVSTISESISDAISQKVTYEFF